jgi:hypothetical protein
MLRAIASKPTPRYTTRLIASLPQVQGRENDNALPSGASITGDENAPESWKSGKVTAISRIVSVDELRILEERTRPTDSVKMAIRVVVK